MFSASTIKQIAAKVGFDLCGIAKCRNFPINEKAYHLWLDRGYDSTLRYMRNHMDKRFDVQALVDGAKSVVVCAVSYKSSISGGYCEQDSTRIASYACVDDYHKTLKKMLLAMQKELLLEDHTLQLRVFVDTAPLLEKQYAVEAGLGWIGRQSLLITPQYGSYVLLAELVLDKEVDSYDEPMKNVGCGMCRRCVDACPTGAIVEPMVIDTSRCISCHTKEAEHNFELEQHGWIFGCEECQNICPYNKRAAEHSNPKFNPLFDPREIKANEWLAMSEEEFTARFGTTPLKRSGLERIKRSIKI